LTSGIKDDALRFPFRLAILGERPTDNFRGLLGYGHWPEYDEDICRSTAAEMHYVVVGELARRGKNDYRTITELGHG
jgi:hypothetical protein